MDKDLFFLLVTDAHQNLQRAVDMDANDDAIKPHLERMKSLIKTLEGRCE